MYIYIYIYITMRNFSGLRWRCRALRGTRQGCPVLDVARSCCTARARAACALCVSAAVGARQRVQHVRGNLLRWTTGRIRWKLDPMSAFVCNARRACDGVVAGPSGHEGKFRPKRGGVNCKGRD